MTRSEIVKLCLDRLTEGGFDAFEEPGGNITFNVAGQSFSLLMADGPEIYVPPFFIFRRVEAEPERDMTVAVEPEEKVHFWRCSDCNITFAHLGWVPPPCPACGVAKCIMKRSTQAEKEETAAVAA